MGIKADQEKREALIAKADALDNFLTLMRANLVAKGTPEFFEVNETLLNQVYLKMDEALEAILDFQSDYEEVGLCLN